MKREKWIKWEPIEDIPQTLYQQDINYDSNGLTISLHGRKRESPILTINFEWFFSLRIMDEGNFLKESCDIDEAVIKMKLNPGSLHKWSLYTVENSPFLEWFHQESAGINMDLDIVHYVISTPNDVIEILYSKKTGNPIVKWI